MAMAGAAWDRRQLPLPRAERSERAGLFAFELQVASVHNTSKPPVGVDTSQPDQRLETHAYT